MSETNQHRSGASVANDLERGRECCATRAWAKAYRLLSLADRAAALEAGDLNLLAISAYLTGRDDEYLKTLERAYGAWLDAGENTRAARCAFWMGLGLLFQGESGNASGWFARARRLIEGEERDCVEQGYLLLPKIEQQLATGDNETAYTTATDAAEIGERFGEAELVACARHLQGRALMQKGNMHDGLALLDEAMVALTTGELSPVMTGLVYCSVIDSCQKMYAFGRAREWTAALARWCDGQPELVAFTGSCMVHRAEIMQMTGNWQDAIEEARRACERFSRGIEARPPAAAIYQEAEVYRLKGEYTKAEDAYRSANKWGGDSQPGLALLRVAQGRADTAATAIRGALGATADRMQRAGLLPACVEIMLAAGDIAEARAASDELHEIGEIFDSGMLGAMAAQAQGAVELAEGNATAALGSLRRARKAWQEIEAPYAAARVRELAAQACRAFGDDEGAELELDAAAATYEQLGAAPDLARINALATSAPPDRPHGLTPRELQVLRLVATGKTNKAVAAELFVSEKTVDRHVSNIFNKLDVPSRSAATAFAYENELV